MTSNKKNTLFLNTLLFIGLFYTSIPIQVDAVPVQLIPNNNIKYPIHIACECDYYLYVDDKYIEQANTEVNVEENWEQGHPGWNATKKFYPVIDNESPKIIAFNGIGGQFSGFLNGFVMDFNEGKDYTKYKEWKCKDFSKTVNNIPTSSSSSSSPSPPLPPPNWFTFDYNDSDWNMATSLGENYQNNSFQIFQHEREGISLKAEWLWTSDNSNKNIYCRKKNTNIITTPPPSTSMPPSGVSTTIHLSTTSAPLPTTSAPTRVQTSAPMRVSTMIHTTPVQTSAPMRVSTTIHTTPVQTSAPIRVQTSAPTRVSTMIHTTPVQTSAPIPLQTSAPIHVQTSAPMRVSTMIHTTPVQTSAPIPVQTSAPMRVQTSAPIRVQTSAPTRVSTMIHTTPVQTSAPMRVQTSAPIRVQTSAPMRVSTMIHTTPVQTSAPIHVQTSAHIPLQTSAHIRVSTMIRLSSTTVPLPTTSVPMPMPMPIPVHVPVPTIVISPHIQIIIQNIKYSQRRSYAHLDNLFRKLKLYNDEYSLYKQLMIARLHIRQHYSALFYDIKHLLEKQNNYDSIPISIPTPTIDKNDNKKSVKNIPRYIQSMHTLNKCIKKIEKSIQFIKGNHKYILLRILNKLKLQYQQDTEKLFMLIKNTR
jgi:hypothetical protein